MTSVIIGYEQTKCHTAHLMTLIAAVQEFARMIGAPIVQGAWAQALYWGDTSLGFPFDIIAVSSSNRHKFEYDLMNIDFLLYWSTMRMVTSVHLSRCLIDLRGRLPHE
jgi:hypothetical protein